jgi:hypothetical protein
MNGSHCIEIFQKSILDYHKTDNVDTPIQNPFEEGTIDNLLYLKNWIDTVQWHLEDIIRSPSISPSELVAVKRRIDASNQHRTDTVERIDDWFMEQFKAVEPKEGAKLNSETPAWLVDRMSILMLKIFHMKEQTERTDVDENHLVSCQQKLAILEEQRVDMTRCFDELMEDIQNGDRYMKVYRQMKMYNDDKLNPVLYGEKKSQ